MALGEWTVRELVAHGARAFKTVAEYVEGEPKDPTRIATAAEYFRIVLAEHGVDPKLGRIFYLTRGAGLESGLEVLPMAGEQLASLKGVRARAKRADSPLASIPQGSARVTLAATNQGLVGAPAAMVTMATALEVGLPASAQQSLPLAPFAAALLSENKPRRFV